MIDLDARAIVVARHLAAFAVVVVLALAAGPLISVPSGAAAALAATRDSTHLIEGGHRAAAVHHRIRPRQHTASAPKSTAGLLPGERTGVAGSSPRSGITGRWPARHHGLAVRPPSSRAPPR